MQTMQIICSEFPPGPGGIGEHAYNLAYQLSKNNFRVSVICPKTKIYSTKKISRFKNINIYRYRDYRLIKIITIICKMIKQYIANSNTIVISSGQIPLIIVGCMNFLLKNDCIAILHGHEILMGSKVKLFFVKNALNNYKKIIAVSNFSKEATLKKLPHLEISVINNGVDINRFKSFKRNINFKKGNNINLLTLGSVSPRKGQQNVIKALPILKEHFKNVKYHMVGANIYKNEIDSLISSLDVEDNVHFHGYLDDNELVKIINDTEIFIMLSENLGNGDVEGFGIAILEANYFGLPAIGSNDCGIIDAINDGETGLLINKKNPLELVEAIKKIKNNYENFSFNSIQWALSHSWDIVSKAYFREISTIDG